MTIIIDHKLRGVVSQTKVLFCYVVTTSVHLPKNEQTHLDEAVAFKNIFSISHTGNIGGLLKPDGLCK